MNTWLPLTDYSNKHKVSVSTLRRRIKTEDIKYKLTDGKYFILDELPINTQKESQVMHRPSLKSEISLVPLIDKGDPKGEKSEPILTAANKILNELKKAYMQILQEKEEQILQLRGEVVNLKTLVRVLEAENLKNQNKR